MNSCSNELKIRRINGASSLRESTSLWMLNPGIKIPGIQRLVNINSLFLLSPPPIYKIV